jgi:tRNA nucleotidyltransferase/poly(A) polymerase
MKIKKKDIIFEERVKSDIPIPADVKKLHKLFKENSFELYIVGGAVRDTLMNKKIKDYDMATDATPQQMEPFLTKAGIKHQAVEVGGKQAVMNVFMPEQYEIATFRAESKASDGRRPDSIEFADIATDVLRRDLTINALFYDIDTGEIVDLVGGIDDIKNRVIKTVGDPKDRFEEDRLRILRAIRFAARTGYNMDPELEKELGRDSSLEKISGERIRDEFIKGIRTAKSTKVFLSILDKYNLFDFIFKGLSPINKNFVESNDPVLVIACMLSEVPVKGLQKKLTQLNYGKKGLGSEVKKIVFMLEFKETFGPQTLASLKDKYEVSELSADTLRAFANELGMMINIVNKFIDYELTPNLSDYIENQVGIPKGSKEFGDKKKELEWKNFINS